MMEVINRFLLALVTARFRIAHFLLGILAQAFIVNRILSDLLTHAQKGDKTRFDLAVHQLTPLLWLSTFFLIALTSGKRTNKEYAAFFRLYLPTFLIQTGIWLMLRATLAGMPSWSIEYVPLFIDEDVRSPCFAIGILLCLAGLVTLMHPTRIDRLPSD